MFFRGNPIIRKEFFGALILLRDGRRYQVKNKFYTLLKQKYSKRYGYLKVDLEELTRDDSIINQLIELNILTDLPEERGRVVFIENKYISKDCLSYPRTIYWECTRRCNYECIHCYSSSGQTYKSSELPYRVVKKLIDEMSLMGAEFLSIGGGEPMLYNDLFKVIKYAKKKMITVEMTTNASLLTDASIRRLKDAGLEFIQVSVDGAKEKTYSMIRKKGDFDKVIKNIKKITPEFTVSVCMVINKINYNEVDPLIDLSKKMGVKHFRIVPFMEIGRGAELRKLQLNKMQFRRFYSHILKRKELESKINIQLNENLIVPGRKNISWMPRNHYGCSAGRSTCGIDYQGNVYPCSYMVFDRLICGNIKEKALFEIWKNSSIFKEIRELSKLRGKCANCKYLSLCRGGCRAAAYAQDCHLDDSDPLCSVI